MRRPMRAKLHTAENKPSFEGILTGWPRRNAGHYVMDQVTLIPSHDTRLELEGRQWIPADRVFFVQELTA